jgi:hypothetical protein
VGTWYATREDIKSALDVLETARNDGQVDRAIEAASRAVEGLTHRRFYPEIVTRYFDWPQFAPSRPWRLWLENNEVISLSAVTSGGTTISASDYFLRRADGVDESPYTMLEIDLSSSAAFESGSTNQRTIALTGLFGFSDVNVPAGVVNEALDASETAVEVSDSATIGVGSVLKVDSEYMIVTEKSWLLAPDTLGGTGLTVSMADVTCPAASGSAFVTGEVILLDAEKMKIVDIAGTNLIVKRAWDGSVLATHATGTAIYAKRLLTVTRGALGSTAATHSISAAVRKQVPPGPVINLTVAYALNELLQEGSGFARVAGSGDNQKEFTGRGIAALERDVMQFCGRQARLGVA